MPMKYYTYISDVKLDMLFSQIPLSFKESVCAELRINFGVFEASLKANDLEKTRVSKLNIVEKYIRRHESVGTIDRPETYIHASDQPLCIHTLVLAERELIVFLAETQDSLLVMTGSGNHVIGCLEEQAAATDFSMPWRMIEALDAVRRTFGPKVDASGALPVQEISNCASILLQEKPMQRNQRYQFFARTFQREQDQSKTVILASPIYVAIV